MFFFVVMSCFLAEVLGIYEDQCDDHVNESRGLLHVRNTGKVQGAIAEELNLSQVSGKIPHCVRSQQNWHDKSLDCQSLKDATSCFRKEGCVMEGRSSSLIDADITIKQTKRTTPSGYYNHRNYTEDACTLVNKHCQTAKDSCKLARRGCQTLNDFDCGGGEKCLKWGGYCYAGRVQVPQGIKVTLYGLKWSGWEIDKACLGNNHWTSWKVTDSWINDDNDMTFHDGSVCAFKFETKQGFHCRDPAVMIRHKGKCLSKTEKKIKHYICNVGKQCPWTEIVTEFVLTNCSSSDESQMFLIDTEMKIKSYLNTKLCLDRGKSPWTWVPAEGNNVIGTKCEGAPPWSLHGKQIRAGLKPSELKDWTFGVWDGPCLSSSEQGSQLAKCSKETEMELLFDGNPTNPPDRR